jgi:hypothetical protein
MVIPKEARMTFSGKVGGAAMAKVCYQESCDDSCSAPYYKSTSCGTYGCATYTNDCNKTCYCSYRRDYRSESISAHSEGWSGDTFWYYHQGTYDGCVGHPYVWGAITCPGMSGFDLEKSSSIIEGRACNAYSYKNNTSNEVDEYICCPAAPSAAVDVTEYNGSGPGYPEIKAQCKLPSGVSSVTISVAATCSSYTAWYPPNPPTHTQEWSETKPWTDYGTKSLVCASGESSWTSINPASGFGNIVGGKTNTLTGCKLYSITCGSSTIYASSSSKVLTCSGVSLDFSNSDW